MKKYIKIGIALVIAIITVKVTPFAASSPDDLAYNFKSFGFTTVNRMVALFPQKKSDTVPTYAQGDSLISKEVRAEEEKVVEYKGKKLTFKVFDTKQDLSPEVLELLYQLELKKESGSHLSIPNN